MPLPTWYRIMRTLPGVVLGLIFLGMSTYFAVSPTTYRDPNNPKLVAYTNSIHPYVVAFMGAIMLGSLALIYFGFTRYFRLPDYLREYSYEQLQLGRALAREIVRLTADGEFHHRSVKYSDGWEISIYADSFYDRGRMSWRLPLFYGFGETVSFIHAEPPTEVDGVLHVPEIRFYIDTFSGKGSRHESVEQYEIREEPPVLEGDTVEFLKFAIRETGTSEEWEGTLESLTEPRFTTVRLDREVGDPYAYYQFMRQMGLDKPSAEELRLALDRLKEW